MVNFSKALPLTLLGVLGSAAGSGNNECNLDSYSTAELEPIVPYVEIAELASFVEYCIYTDKVTGEKIHIDSISNEMVCTQRFTSQWVVNEMYTDESATGGLSTEDKYKCAVMKAPKKNVYVGKMNADRYHGPTEFEILGKKIGEDIEDLQVVNGDKYVRVYITEAQAKELMATGDFQYLSPLPVEFKVSPTISVEGAIAAAGDDSQMRGKLVVTHHGSIQNLKASIQSTLDTFKTQEGISSLEMQNVNEDTFTISSTMSKSSVPLLSALLASKYTEIQRMDILAEAEFFNQNAAFLTQSGYARGGEEDKYVNNKGLHGENEIVAVADSGLDYWQCHFYDANDDVNWNNAKSYDLDGVSTPVWEGTTHRKLTHYIAWADTKESKNGGHGTHVAGSVAGKSTSATSEQYNGMAPEAKIAFLDIGIGDAGGLSIPSLGEAAFPIAYDTGSRIHTNSWGSSYKFANHYDSSIKSVDKYTYYNQDFVVLFAAGNSGEHPMGQDAPYGTICSPGTGKNTITVGATKNNMNDPDLAYFSSRGPTYDGRMKPEVTAPGHPVTSANSWGNPVKDQCTTVGMSGTSMATPVLAGHTALIRQYFLEGYYPTGRKTSSDGFVPMAALVKAMFVNSGQYMSKPEANRDGVYSSPNIDQGWGMVNLKKTMFFGDAENRDLFVDGEFSEDGSKSPIFGHDGQTKEYKFTITDPAEEFRATLAWSDFPTTKGSKSAALINDLDLEVFVNYKQFFPNGKGGRDAINVVEQVAVGGILDAGDIITVRIRAHSISKWQPFSVVVTGGFQLGGNIQITHTPTASPVAPEKPVTKPGKPGRGKSMGAGYAVTGSLNLQGLNVNQFDDSAFANAVAAMTHGKASADQVYWADLAGTDNFQVEFGVAVADKELALDILSVFSSAEDLTATFYSHFIEEARALGVYLPTNFLVQNMEVEESLRLFDVEPVSVDPVSAEEETETETETKENKADGNTGNLLIGMIIGFLVGGSLVFGMLGYYMKKESKKNAGGGSLIGKDATRMQMQSIVPPEKGTRV